MITENDHKLISSAWTKINYLCDLYPVNSDLKRSAALRIIKLLGETLNPISIAHERFSAYFFQHVLDEIQRDQFSKINQIRNQLIHQYYKEVTFQLLNDFILIEASFLRSQLSNISLKMNGQQIYFLNYLMLRPFGSTLIEGLAPDSLHNNFENDLPYFDYEKLCLMEQYIELAKFFQENHRELPLLSREELVYIYAIDHILDIVSLAAKQLSVGMRRALITSVEQTGLVKLLKLLTKLIILRNENIHRDIAYETELTEKHRSRTRHRIDILNGLLPAITATIDTRINPSDYLGASSYVLTKRCCASLAIALKKLYFQFHHTLYFIIGTTNLEFSQHIEQMQNLSKEELTRKKDQLVDLKEIKHTINYLQSSGNNCSLAYDSLTIESISHKIYETLWYIGNVKQYMLTEAHVNAPIINNLFSSLEESLFSMKSQVEFDWHILQQMVGTIDSLLENSEKPDKGKREAKSEQDIESSSLIMEKLEKAEKAASKRFRESEGSSSSTSLSEEESGERSPPKKKAKSIQVEDYPLPSEKPSQGLANPSREVRIEQEIIKINPLPGSKKNDVPIDPEGQSILLEEKEAKEEQSDDLHGSRLNLGGGSK